MFVVRCTGRGPSSLFRAAKIKGRVVPMRHQKLFLLYIAAVVVVFIIPNPESLIVRAVERAGLVMIVVRGLKGHYDDFAETINDVERKQ
jgi:hypothetical protein